MNTRQTYHYSTLLGTLQRRERARKMEKKRDDRERPPSVHGGDDDDAYKEEKAAVETGHRRRTTSSSWLFVGAHPCSLMQRIVRACAGCLLGLCGAGSVRDGAQPGAAADADFAAAAASQREADRGSKVVLRDMASAQVLAARRPPRRPSGPREGRGGGGGSHN